MYTFLPFTRTAYRTMILCKDPLFRCTLTLLCPDSSSPTERVQHEIQACYHHTESMVERLISTPRPNGIGKMEVTGVWWCRSCSLIRPWLGVVSLTAISLCTNTRMRKPVPRILKRCILTTTPFLGYLHCYTQNIAQRGLTALQDFSSRNSPGWHKNHKHFPIECNADRRLLLMNSPLGEPHRLRRLLYYIPSFTSRETFTFRKTFTSQ